MFFKINFQSFILYELEVVIIMSKKLNNFLNCVIGSFTGVFIGHSIYKYFHYKNNPGLYEIQSVPWYTSIKVYGLGTAVVIFIAIIIKFLIKNKEK